MTVRAATVAWKLRPTRRDSDYFGHFHDLVSRAYDGGAEIVVFPELHVLEVLPMAENLHEAYAPRFLCQFADAIERWLERIAASSDMTIVGGSHFRETPVGIKNVAAIAVPGRPVVLAQKNNLTRYESEVWGLARGTGLVATTDGLGVSVCYDSEFPEAGRALAEAGTRIQCVPAWTETQRGFQRVRWSCLARAIENQTFVVHSSLVGDLGREPAPASYGSSAILAPSVEPFPVEAVLAETPINDEGVAFADLDLDALEQARQVSEVSNWLDRYQGDWTVASPDQKPKTDPRNPDGRLN